MARKLSGTAISPGTITVTQLETTVVTAVTTGGGPKIANIQITANNYSVLDDTAVDTAGGYIKLNGSGFVNGCIVVINGQQATSTGFVSATQVQAQVPALTAGTYPVYLINPDGGTAIRVPGLTYSATPTWVTSSSLSEGSIDIPISVQFSANGASVYSLAAGSSLPAGLTLSNVGLLSGTVTGLLVDTVYSFTVVATDAELQDSPRTFTITITASDQYFRYTTLLLSGDFPSSANLAYNSDASTNNFLVTASGDVGPRPFSPYYGANYSAYFDGASDYVSLASSSDFTFGTGDFAVEGWIYPVGWSGGSGVFQIGTSLFPASVSNSVAFGLEGTPATSFQIYAKNAQHISAGGYLPNRWYHFAVTRVSSTTRLFINGSTAITVSADSTNYTASVLGFGAIYGIGNYYNGYISNVRVIKGSSPYNTDFTAPTAPFAPGTANQGLLVFASNRFIDTNTTTAAKALTVNGDTRITDNSPFTVTDTVSGSAYFDYSNDNLMVADATALDLGLGNFTIECWIYLTAGSGFYRQFFSKYTGGVGIEWYVSNSNKLEVYFNGGAGLITSATTINTNTWYHVALVRSGTGAGQTKFYINGSEDGSNQVNLNLDNAGALYFGESGAASNDYPGYICDMRIVKGTAVYTGAFTPPTSLLKTSGAASAASYPSTTNVNTSFASSETSLLTLQTRTPANNSVFIDSSPNEFLITRNGNATQGSFSPFSPGGWSGYWPGTDINSGFSIGTNVFGANDFTVEFYYWLNDLSVTAGTLVTSPLVTSHNWYGGTSNYSFSTYATTTAIGFALSTGGGSNEGTAPVTGISVNTTDHRNGWVHIAAVRSGGTIRLFVNGSGTSSALSSNTGINLDARNIYVGRWFDSASAPSAERYGKGYFHSLRVIVGQALYSGNFTVGGQSLTSTSVGTTGANVAASITGTVHTLALQSNRFLNRVGNVAYTITGNPSIQSFSPFAPTASYSPAVHGGSVYLDGTGDYLTVPSSTNFNFGTSDFTIECWVYQLSRATDSFECVWALNGPGTTGTSPFRNGMYLTLGSYANQGSFLVSNASENGWAVEIANVSLPRFFTWEHYAVARVGNVWTVYKNGVSTGTTTVSASVPASKGPFAIGTQESGGQYWPGYISAFRVVKGVSLYNGNFVPPTAPPTAVPNTTLLLNFTNAAVADLTGRNQLESVGNVQASRTQAKWNYLTTGASLYFSGSSSYFDSLNGPNYVFGTGDFTIEFWLNTSSTSFGLLQLTGGTTGYWQLNVVSSTMFWQSSRNTVNLISTSATSILNGAWHYVAVIRSSGTLRIYFNGSLQASQADSTNYNGSAGLLRIGYDTNNAFLNGYISNLRITKGIARTFALPTGPFKTR